MPESLHEDERPSPTIDFPGLPLLQAGPKRAGYPVIDLEANPALTLGLRADSLFFMTCKICAKQFESIHEILVLDDKTIELCKLFARIQEYIPDQTNFSRIHANWVYTAIASV